MNLIYSNLFHESDYHSSSTIVLQLLIKTTVFSAIVTEKYSSFQLAKINYLMEAKVVVLFLTLCG